MGTIRLTKIVYVPLFRVSDYVKVHGGNIMNWVMLKNICKSVYAHPSY